MANNTVPNPIRVCEVCGLTSMNIKKLCIACSIKKRKAVADKRKSAPKAKRPVGTGKAEQFIRAVVADPPDECVIWPFSCNSQGYGRIRFQGKIRRAHRVALTLATGEEPAGLAACHAPGICHTPACVNPRHLRWATQKENSSDREIDGTDMRGEKNHRAIISESDAAAVMADIRPVSQVAASFGIQEGTVYSIRSGKTWGHVGRGQDL